MVFEMQSGMQTSRWLEDCYCDIADIFDAHGVVIGRSSVIFVSSCPVQCCQIGGLDMHPSKVIEAFCLRNAAIILDRVMYRVRATTSAELAEVRRGAIA